MSKTIEYLADQAVLMVTGGRPTVEGLDKREVMAMISDALPFVAVEEYWNNYKAINQNEVQSQWLIPFQITLTTNPVLNVQEAILPESYIAFPKDRGVYKVQGDCAAFTKIDYNKYEMLKDGALLNFLDKPCYSVIGNQKILILPFSCHPVNVSSVIVTLALANSSTLSESQGLLVLNRILPNLRLRMGMPADMITDQNPNIK